MRFKHFLHINAGLFLIGITIAGIWIYLTGGAKSLDRLIRVHPAYIVQLLAITAFCVFGRFIRWQFLLRRVGVRVPARPSLSIYFASLVGIATPAYMGELIRSLFMRKKFGIPIRITTSVLIVERLLDIIALGVIAAITVNAWWMWEVMALIVAGACLVGILGGSLARSVGVPTDVLLQLRKGSILLQSFGISLIAWVPASLLVSLAAASLESSVAPLAGMRVFSTATLLGGFTLMPAGVGSTGSIAILQLENLGLPLALSVVVVSLVRLTSTGLSLAVGIVFLLLELKVLRQAVATDSSAHFNEITQEYKEQFSDHIWNHLLERKIRLLTAALPNPPSSAGIGLDLGCGLGQQCLAMGKRGYQVVGIDVAQNLVRQACIAGVTVVNGNALALPFRDASFEFIYTIGVLHHLPGTKEQGVAYRELVRVLKPGGILIVHETNPCNPIFRFYMGYVFPILKSIDEGTEWWVQPHFWEKMEGLKLLNLQYFTFLPDFIPQCAMRPFLAVERLLEASSLRSYSVHYMVVLQRSEV